MITNSIDWSNALRASVQPGVGSEKNANEHTNYT
jgi:hypothetical protein